MNVILSIIKSLFLNLIGRVLIGVIISLVMLLFEGVMHLLSSFWNSLSGTKLHEFITYKINEYKYGKEVAGVMRRNHCSPYIAKLILRSITSNQSIEEVLNEMEGTSSCRDRESSNEEKNKKVDRTTKIKKKKKKK